MGTGEESGATSPAARAAAAAKAGRWAEAEGIVAMLVREAFGLDVASVSVVRDRYSLNSVHGRLSIADGTSYFFKFHHEEGEEATLREFYQAEILAEAGYDVDVPAFAAREVGRQILLYALRETPRLADVCRAIDLGEAPDLSADVLAAQARADDAVAAIYLRTLHAIDATASAAEPIHQLFHARLVDPGAPDRLGARARRFFFDRTFRFGGTEIDAAALRRARWRINGTLYRTTLGEALEAARTLLAPDRLARFGGVVAHGDAHNANVWFEHDRGRLVYFDPAFAGRHVPAILAEVKATFHNALAHPLWLYDPAEVAARQSASVAVRGDEIAVETDWALSPLRERLLEIKAERLWRPLLAELALRALLPTDWEATLRAALFACPTLVMDLAAGGAGGHNPVSSAIGLSVAMTTAGAPETADDPVSRLIEAIRP
jgi:hypothetical protein